MPEPSPTTTSSTTISSTTASGRDSSTPLVLDAYAARSCPVKTQNRFDRTVAGLHSARASASGGDGGADEQLLELFAGAKSWELEVLAELAGCADGVTDLREPGEELPGHRIDLGRRLELTSRAVTRGDRVVIAPALPVDLEGHRSGRPALIVRGVDRADGGPGYVPVEIKRHRMVEQFNGSDGTARFSTMAHPGVLESRLVPEFTVRSGREADLLQLAHHWRLLDAAGWATDDALAGVVGSDHLPGLGGPVIAWIDLRAKFLRTFSRRAASGWALRSPLERYDHEFGFRVKVAEVAQQRTGSPDDPRAMVAPIVIRECDHCPWWSTCAPLLHDDDLSLRINKSPLDVREIATLRALGVETLTDLASADVDALLTTYLPEVRHRDGAERRLRLAARRASLLLAGVELERVSDDPIALPEAELEIDFDIETTADDRVYLWGFLVDDRRHPDEPPRFVEFSTFTDLDTATENELARQAITWLDEQLTGARSALVYHYSDFETLHIRRLTRRMQDPALVAAGERVIAACVDMFVLVRENFFGANGLGLKVVAHAGAGFEWRDEDPGGLNSQRWFQSAVFSPDAAERAASRQRVLDYNEDDVRATHALRGWLRQLELERTRDS